MSKQCACRVENDELVLCPPCEDEFVEYDAMIAGTEPEGR